MESAKKPICGAGRGRIAGNTNTGLLKLLALVFMVTDHVGAKFFPGIFELRIIGRLAFPLYLWCAVVGAEYTRNHWRYALRLLLFALISQPFYMWGLNHQLHELNVMFTLFFGVLGLISIKEKKYYSHIWGPAFVIAAGCIFKMDYGWRGILFMLLMYSCRQRRAALFSVMLAFCMYWGADSAAVSTFFGIDLNILSPYLPYGRTLLRAVTRLQFMAFFASPLILINMNLKFKMPKWLGYAAYPGHLAIIAILRYLLQM